MDQLETKRADQLTYQYYAEMLADENVIDNTPAFNYFRMIYHIEKMDPPENLDDTVVDALLCTVRNKEREWDVRVLAALCLRSFVLTQSHDLPTHTALREKLLIIFVRCIRRSNDLRLLELLLWYIFMITKHCDNCNKASSSRYLIRTIVDKIHSGVFNIKIAEYALDCCWGILSFDESIIHPKVARRLVSAIMIVVRRFDHEMIRQKSLQVLSFLAYDSYYKESSHVISVKNAMLNENDLIPMALKAIPTQNEFDRDLVLSLFLRMIFHARLYQIKRMIAHDGFMANMGLRFDSTGTNVYYVAIFFANLTVALRNHLTPLLKEVEIVMKLMHLLHSQFEGTKRQREACRFFANILASLNKFNPRPEERHDFIHDGVLKMIDIQSKSGAEPRLVNEIRESLPPLLLAHTTFWSVFEEFTKYLDLVVKEENVKTICKNAESIAFIIAEAQ